MPENLENSAEATGLEKIIFIPIPKKGNAKVCSNYHTIALISHTSKGFGIVNKTEIDVFLELSCFFHGLITHLEPDILEGEVKWTLGSISMNKASGGDRIQLSYFNS